jgi:arylsulfatase A-like enzyme
VTDQPNIVLVHWHDLGRHLGTYGRHEIVSPNVDRLAAEGIQFNQAFSTAPLCSPARGSLFTGRYPHDNGLLGLAHLGWEYRPGTRTLPALLGKAGYRTVLAGMQHESSDPGTLGFDEMYALREPNRPAYCERVADAAVSWLSRRGDDDTPFFLVAGFEEVHRPYPADRYPPVDPSTVEIPSFLPDNEWTRDDLASFQSCIRVADAAAGQILSTVEKYGLTENTWVVFTTDHGMAFPRAKSTLYDPGIGVAMIMRPPGLWTAPRGATDRLFSHVDFVPTVLDQLGIEIPPEVQGVSHAAWLRGQDPAAARERVYAEKNFHDVYDPIRGVRETRFKYLRNFEERPILSLPTDIESSPTRHGYGDDHLRHRPSEELYDLREDPWEHINLATQPAYAEVCERLVEELRSWQISTGDPLSHGRLPARPWPRQRRYGALVSEEDGPGAR